MYVYTHYIHTQKPKIHFFKKHTIRIYEHTFPRVKSMRIYVHK